MSSFELLERDGFARLGRLRTAHGTIDTPALFPVVHPARDRQPVPPRALRARFGLGAVITSAYIIHRTPPLREKAERDGVHGLLDFDGPVMTDSGAFQQHAYGHIDVDSDTIVEFQRRIGSDIVTVLDVFTEPGSSADAAKAAVTETVARATRASGARSDLLAVPVQGALFPELRLASAEAASSLGDIAAVGGVVPLMERYQFSDLARVLLASRPGLAPETAVHLFGSGHPMTFALAAVFGVDLFDSAAYLKFARRGDLLFPEGTVPIDRLRETTCPCSLCKELPLPAVARLSEEERVRRIAEHNLLISATELGTVRQAIRDATLWELVERRAAAHPALLAGLKAIVRDPGVFLPVEPDSRPAFRFVGPTSGSRPAAQAFYGRLARYVASRGPFRNHPWVPLTPSGLSRTPVRDSTGSPIYWQCLTPFGPVPLELTEAYPVGSALSVDEFEGGHRRVAGPATRQLSVGPSAEVGRPVSGTDEWTHRHAAAVLEWCFGEPAASSILGVPDFRGGRSRTSGRLHRLEVAGRPAFAIGRDGLPRPTWVGGNLLHRALAFPARRVVVDPDAIEFVTKGKTLFSKFVQEADPDLVPGNHALLVDGQDRLLAVGRLLLAPTEMGRLTRGVAVRVTAHERARLDAEDESEGSLESG